MRQVYDDVGDESDVRYAIPTASGWRRPPTGPERFDLGCSDVDWYADNYGDDADADDEEEGSLANDGSTHNVEDWGYSTTRECEDWTVLYFRPVKYDTGEANATASDVSEAKTVL